MMCLFETACFALRTGAFSGTTAKERMPMSQAYMYVVMDLFQEEPVGAFTLCREAEMAAEQWTRSKGAYCSVTCVHLNECCNGILTYETTTPLVAD